jgi:hypothetical protein
MQQRAREQVAALQPQLVVGSPRLLIERQNP